MNQNFDEGPYDFGEDPPRLFVYSTSQESIGITSQQTSLPYNNSFILLPDPSALQKNEPTQPEKETLLTYEPPMKGHLKKVDIWRGVDETSTSTHRPQLNTSPTTSVEFRLVVENQEQF